jgi:excinuclease UvrABC nuclease subunit
MPADEVVKLGKRLDREMAKAARDLQFERAAQLRDQLIGLRKAMTDSRAAGESQTVAAGAGTAREGGRRGGGRWRRGR